MSDRLKAEDIQALVAAVPPAFVYDPQEERFAEDCARHVEQVSNIYWYHLDAKPELRPEGRDVQVWNVAFPVPTDGDVEEWRARYWNPAGLSLATLGVNKGLRHFGQLRGTVEDGALVIYASGWSA